MVAIIDYDAGNLKSVEKALQAVGGQPVITRDVNILLDANKVILPGVGSFGDAMKRLHQYGLVDVIHQIVERQIPLLGICLGQQLLFERSEESPEIQGLGILKGEVLRIPAKDGLKIPHMGWNSLKLRQNTKLYEGIEEGAYVYFVHSYYVKAGDESVVAGITEYGTSIHASIETGHVFACQFHPEKSSDVGLKILENFVKL